jgi:hypothetical protein
MKKEKKRYVGVKVDDRRPAARKSVPISTQLNNTTRDWHDEAR